MEINPIIVIGLPSDGTGDASKIEANWRRAQESGIGCVIINKDIDTDVADSAAKAGAYVYTYVGNGETNQTNYETESGAERVARSLAEFDRFYNHDIVINVHANLPEMAANVIKAVMYPLADPYMTMSTFVVPITEEEAKSESVVKVQLEILEERRVHVLNNSQVANVTGFTRKISEAGEAPYYKQIPIYAYRRASLDVFVRHEPTVREMEENLEPERALANGMRVGAVLLNSGYDC